MIEETNNKNNFKARHYYARLNIFLSLEVVLISIWFYFLFSVGFAILFNNFASGAASDMKITALKMVKFSESMLDPIVIVIWLVLTIIFITLILFAFGKGIDQEKLPISSAYLKKFKNFSISMLVIAWFLTVISLWILKAVIPWNTIHT